MKTGAVPVSLKSAASKRENLIINESSDARVEGILYADEAYRTFD